MNLLNLDITRPPANPLHEKLELLQEQVWRWNTNKLYRYYPDEGPLRRELYPKHIEFFEAGAEYFERLMLAANRVGKTEAVGGYELTLHLTGRYPSWWKGKRFNRPVKAWAAGDTSKTVRDIIQGKLLGEVGSFGTGLIPVDDLIDTKPKSGIPDAVEIIKVKHVSGGTSVVILKSYDQGRESYQGTEQDVIWLDEEPPLDVYTECLMRLMTTNGTMMCTFTPLEGISQTVMYFLPSGDWQNTQPDANKYIVMATWDDAPHLTAAQKQRLWAGIPEYQRDARTKGIPQLGAGAIYPIPESEILVDPFEIPAHYARCYGFDVGWNKTAAVWGAIDRDTETCYLYSEYYRGKAEPSIHAHGIRNRGWWIYGAVDPASRGRSQRDGEQLFRDYTDLGLKLIPAQNTREAGILKVWEWLSYGKLKVFKNLQNWRSEYRLYRRDDKGNVIKENDHLMDTTRYLVMTGINHAKTEMEGKQRLKPLNLMRSVNMGWMGA